MVSFIINKISKFIASRLIIIDCWTKSDLCDNYRLKALWPVAHIVVYEDSKVVSNSKCGLREVNLTALEQNFYYKPFYIIGELFALLK